MQRLYSSLILGTPMCDPAAGEIIEHKSDRFYDAMRAGDTAEVVQMIEAEGFDVDHHAFGHEPPLIFALKLGRKNIVQTLLDYGANPNLADRDGNTPLHFAAVLCDTETAVSLLRYGASASAQNTEGVTPLEIAARCDGETLAGAMRETRALYEPDSDLFALARRGELHGIIRNAPSPSDLRRPDEQRRTLLHHAVFGTNTKLIVWLLNKGLDIDAADLHGITPLIIAASHARFEKILELLIARSATLEHRTDNQATALTLALRNGNPDGAKTLIEAGANIFCVEGVHTPLTLVHRGIERFPKQAPRFRAVQTLLLDKGAHNDIPTNRAGWTPLFHAASRASDPLSKAHLDLLLRLGSDVDYRDANGRTPLMAAAGAGRLYAVEKLIANFAKADVVDAFGWTALMLSVYYDHYEITKFLLETGADADLTSPQGLSALRIARKHKRLRAAELLMQFGAKEEEE